MGTIKASALVAFFILFHIDKPISLRVTLTILLPLPHKQKPGASLHRALLSNYKRL